VGANRCGGGIVEGKTRPAENNVGDKNRPYSKGAPPVGRDMTLKRKKNSTYERVGPACLEVHADTKKPFLEWPVGINHTRSEL